MNEPQLLWIAPITWKPSAPTRAELLAALIATRAALDALQDYIPMRYNRDLQRLLASDQELIERAGGEV